MSKYKLTTPAEIRQAAELAGIAADNEPNQSSYNAAWLHGYAQALQDCADQQAEGFVLDDTPPEYSVN